MSMMEIAATAGLTNGVDYGMNLDNWAFWIQQTPDVMARFQRAQQEIMSKNN